MDFILNPICPGGEFKYTHAEHFRQMMRLIDGDENFTLSDFGEYHLATDNLYHNRKLGLLPRYHGKTRVGTVAFIMWWLMKRPNDRVLIVSETSDLAEAMLKMIKDLYAEIRDTKDTELAYVYKVMGDWVGSPWKENYVFVKQRTTKGTDPSIATAGIMSEVTSKHFDLIICDDLIGEKNTKTKEQLQKAIDHYSSLTEVGDVDKDRVTTFILWGTTWDYNDLYARILNKMKTQYDILKLRCWDDERCRQPTKTLFPEKFSLDYLKSVYKNKMLTGDLDGFYRQYLNEPLPKGSSIFDYEVGIKNNFFDLDDVKHRPLTVVIACDPALSENQWSDYTAIVAVGIDKHGRRYILSYDKFQESDPAMVVHHLKKMALKYWNNDTHRLLTVGIEAGALYNTLEPHLNKFMSWAPYEPLPHKNKNKIFRIIEMLQPFVATRRIYFQRWMDELIEQMVKFPRANVERDLLDALAYTSVLMPVCETENEYTEPPPDNDKMFWEQVTKPATARA